MLEKLLFSFIKAAKGTAQEGSQTIFILSQINFIANIISASETVIILSAPFKIISNVLFASDVFKPSAIVFGLLTGTNFFLTKDSCASEAFNGSESITFVFGEYNLVDIIVPEAKPPPPTGHLILF